MASPPSLRATPGSSPGGTDPAAAPPPWALACFVASLLAMTAVGAAQAAETEFLFDALHSKTPYRASWIKLMKLVQPTPDWLVEFNKNYDGVSGQITELTIDDKPYSMSFVCKPSDCAGHKFVVLFDANGEHAYGALGGKDNDPAFFGSPSPSEQHAMVKAVK